MKSVVHKGTGSEEQSTLTVWEAECYRKGRWEHKLNWKKLHPWIPEEFWVWKQCFITAITGLGNTGSSLEMEKSAYVAEVRPHWKAQPSSAGPYPWSFVDFSPFFIRLMFILTH